MFLRRIAVPAVAVVLGAGVWMAGPAGASTGWTLQATPNPGHQASLSSVSCLAGGTCEAVGTYRPPSQKSGWAPLAMRETSGNGWAAQAAPEPANGFEDELGSVSCLSSSFCEAVGMNISQKQDRFTLAENWNGTKWTIQSTPNPTGDDSSLSGVSCVSPTACMAVGEYGNSSEVDKAFTEFWNGKSWAIVPFTDKFYDVFLTAVSCPSASFCLAIGSDNGHGNGGDLSATWNGTAWTPRDMGGLSGGYIPIMNAVSCASATACTAVGSAFTPSDAQEGLAERWNGTGWSIVTSPHAQLNGVSCPTASACVAVGQAFSNNPKPIAGGWTGTKAWTTQTTTSPPRARDAELYNVSCPSLTDCIATGSYQVTAVSGIGAKPLAEQN
jgi:hypothetical protein